MSTALIEKHAVAESDPEADIVAVHVSLDLLGARIHQRVVRNEMSRATWNRILECPQVHLHAIEYTDRTIKF
jgi:hypothetical protein